MIELYSDDDLVRELSARFDDIVIAGRRVLNNNDDTHRIKWSSGDKDVCAGLALALAQHIAGGNKDDRL